jgi:hypothetical protein
MAEEETKVIYVRVDPELHRRLRIYAAEVGETIQDVVRGWIAEQLGKETVR